MKLGRAFLAAVVALATTSVSLAADVAPPDVKFEDHMVAESISGVPGNPEEGKKAFAGRGLGNCLACHTVAALQNEQFHGDVAPPLDGVADRRTPEELRAIVTDAKQAFGPETVMPGFYSLNVGINVREDLIGKTILTAQQVEDIVAFLSTLKDAK